MDHFRPKNSTIAPDKMLPNGWQMKAMLPGTAIKKRVRESDWSDAKSKLRGKETGEKNRR
jgi:hypothetical protein